MYCFESPGRGIVWREAKTEREVMGMRGGVGGIVGLIVVIILVIVLLRLLGLF